MQSRPTWGVWIEIVDLVLTDPPYGSRAPPGACGLKYQAEDQHPYRGWSRPTWGVWIEMTFTGAVTGTYDVAPHLGRVD